MKKTTKRVGLKISGMLRTTSVSALFRQFGSCFFNYKTLQKTCDERTKISLQVLYSKNYAEPTFKLP
jgi:hypothetical protein